jgi:hypothetical protein
MTERRRGLYSRVPELDSRAGPGGLHVVVIPGGSA